MTNPPQAAPVMTTVLAMETLAATETPAETETPGRTVTLGRTVVQAAEVAAAAKNRIRVPGGKHRLTASAAVSIALHFRTD
ncbi:MAG: hypothetical protein O7F69_09390 [Alphaproteobacteria bacterium]|nr:hypothetical protein [Alphaproteobacteria bacterium]